MSNQTSCVIDPTPSGRYHVTVYRGAWTIRRALPDWPSAVDYARSKTQDANIFIR